MNMLVLNGGPGNGRGEIHRTVRRLFEREGEIRGLSVKSFDLADLNIKPCRGCFACWLKHPGTCAVKDDQEPVLEAMASADVMVWITPLTFGGYSSHLKKSLDRMIPNILPFFIRIDGEVHHPARYDNAQRLIVLGTIPADGEDAAEVFPRLVARNAVNFHSVDIRVETVPEEADHPRLSGIVGKLLENTEASR